MLRVPLDRPGIAPPDRSVVLLAVAIGLGAVLGLAIALGGIPSLVVLGGVAAVVVLASLGAARIGSLFVAVLAILALGYALLNRGFASIGVGPVYVGELGLALAAATWLASLRRFRVGVLEALILLFMAWGAARTIPYVGTYGLDALRDAVTWAYALFALAVAMVMTPQRLERFVDLARRIVPAYVGWVPIAAAISAFGAAVIPAWPGSPVPIVYVKHGDIGVVLAAISAFLLTGLYDRRQSVVPEWLVWVLWLADLAVVGAISRAALLAALVAIGALLPMLRSPGRVVRVGAIGAFLLVVLYVVNPGFGLGYTGRTVTFNQLVSNVLSVVGSGDNEGSLQGNREWRLAWWGAIVGYTVDGPHFWDGKGFGINLADSDGFQVTADDSLRSPHNGHLTILARGGVPMLAIWVALQAAFGAGLWAARRRLQATSGTLADLAAVVFAFWIGALVNTAFDVYLEGPQGGILFWSAVGMGIAIIRLANAPARVDGSLRTPPLAPQIAAAAAPGAAASPRSRARPPAPAVEPRASARSSAAARPRPPRRAPG